jgi:predicted membrane-bound mannosyltransferase
MGGALFILLISVVALIVGAYVVMGTGLFKSSQAGTVEPSAAQGDRRQLRYLVPPGQDPAVLLAALRKAGIVAAEDSRQTPEGPTIVVAEPADREQVRTVLAQTPQTSMDDPAARRGEEVRFLDESPR